MWSTSTRTNVRSFPSIRRGRLVSDESPQFHGMKIRFNHVLQLKKQPFNSGARTYRQLGPVLAWLVTRSAPLASSSVIQKCFYRTASSTQYLPSSSSCTSLPEAWRQLLYFNTPTLRRLGHCPFPTFHIPVNMMPPTCTDIRIRTARDAEIIFHAVRLNILPMVVQRLGSEERMALCSGCVYVWEERSGSLSESMEQGIERFTEGRSWGPSRYGLWS